MKKLTSLNAGRIVLLSAALLATVGASKTLAQNIFTPGDLLVSSSTYAGTAGTVVVGQTLPITPAATASNNGAYFQVFNNETPDPNFGITSPITITQITPAGAGTGVVVNVPGTYLNTSFSSKSELGLNLSTNGTAVTFMAYPAAANQLDLSNSATPGNDFSGDTDVAPATFRAIGQLNADGILTPPTEIIDYSGDNARNAILANGSYYTVGASASANVALAGAEMVTPGVAPGTTGLNSTSLGTFSTKDSANNFRGMTIFNNTLYATKGSGGASKSVDTVYQVGDAGTLPTGTGNAITILPGFNTTTQGNTTAGGPHPFGIWFANATTLYVADEGTGLIADIQQNGTPSFNGNNSFAGLEKWILNTTTNQWTQAYTLTSGLNIGVNYFVSGSVGGATGTYRTATDGLRNITGKVNGDGTATIYAITSTASTEDGTNNAIDEGCDPNKLVAITDTVSDTTASQASSESFTTLQAAVYGQVLRGVSFTPSAPTAIDSPTMPVWALFLLGVLLVLVASGFLPKQSPRLAVGN